MIRLRILGTLALVGEDGRSISSVLTQPKRFALLSYLALSPSPAVHRRDTLLAVFWPDLSEGHARRALRQGLYALRRAVGAEAIISEGDELIGLATDHCWCDATEFRAALSDGREEEALNLYRGPFLQGFHLSGAPSFEQWAEGQRHRLAAAATEAAWRLVDQGPQDPVQIRRWAERALDLAPFDEAGLRRYMLLMTEQGEPAAAIRAYDMFVERLVSELDLRPSGDTAALAEGVRKRSARPSTAVPQAVSAGYRYQTAFSPADTSGVRGAGRLLTSGPSAAEQAPPHRANRYALMVPVAVALATALFFARPGSAPPSRPGAYPTTALAVLPFQNLSTEPDYAYFASGLHDELLTQLSRIAAISLRGRSSVIGYAGTTKPIRQIAEELRAGTLLEGSVQVVGDRLRVNVQLINATTDEHVWAESYDRVLDDAFEIQSDIAQRVVAAVDAALGSGERTSLATAPTENPEAYRLYLQGRVYSRRAGWHRRDFEVAQKLYERALALDPEFALAYAALAEAHGVMHWFRYDASPRRLQAQQEAAEAAHRLAPDLPQAHFAMGQWLYWGQRDYSAALEAFRTALGGMPNEGRIWAYLAWVNRRLGNWNAVEAAFRRATELDPRDATLFADVGGLSYRLTRRYPDAIGLFDRALELAPDLSVAAVEKAWAYAEWHGQLDTLRSVLSLVSRDEDLSWLGNATAQRAEMYLWEGDGDRLISMLADFPGEVLDGHDFYYPTSLYAGWAHDLRGDAPAANRAFLHALAVLDSTDSQLAGDWRLHAARGLALAGLGRDQQALAEAKWLRESAVYRGDAFQGARVAEDHARILAEVGLSDQALDEIERLLARPSKLSIHALRLDPRWSALRGNTQFEALIARVP